MAAALTNRFFEETACPSPVIHVGPGTDKRYLLPETWNPSRKAAEFHGVFLGGKIASTPPRFVSYPPEPHVERIFETAGCANVGESCASCRRVAVLDPTIEFLGGKAAQIRGQIRLTANQFAEMCKLIGTEFIGIVTMAGGRRAGLALRPEVSAPRPLIERADAV